MGNSSSGFESLFFGTPCVNVGTRQAGGHRGKNVIDVDYDGSQIADAVLQHVRHGRYCPDPIYGDGRSAERMLAVLKSYDPTLQKRITY